MENKLPEGWEWKKLVEVSDIIMGQSPSGETYNEKGNGMPFLQGKAEFSDSCPKHVKYTTSPSKVAPEGSILISVRAPVGDVNIANLDYCIGRGLASISLKNGDNKFLFYLLRYLKPEIENKGTGSTFKAISKSILNDITIPLPPLETQQKIVSILEKAEETKKLRAQADELTQKLFQSVFLEMFGDPVENSKSLKIASLENVCSEIYRYPTFYGFEYIETGVPIVRIGNILGDGSLDPNKSNYVFFDPNLNKKFPRTILELNDIVMAVRGDGSTAKRIGLVNNLNIIGANISPNLIRIKANKKVLNPIYLFYFLTSEYGQSILQQSITRTAKKTITAENIKKVAVPCPLIDDQNKFAEIAGQVEKTKQAQQQSAQEINNLFDALMRKAFIGELVS